MQTVYLMLVGVVGTLAGAAITHYFDLQTWKRQQIAATEARREDLRREAVANFAEAMFEYRRLQLQNWSEMRPTDEQTVTVKEDDTAIAAEVREARAQAWARDSRLRLVWGDPALIAKSEDLLRQAAELTKAADRERRRADGDKLRDGLKALIDLARERTSGTRP